MFALGVSGLIGVIARHTPRTIVRGMQLGLGVSLARRGLNSSLYDESGDWKPWVDADGLLVGALAVVFAVAAVFPGAARATAATDGGAAIAGTSAAGENSSSPGESPVVGADAEASTRGDPTPRPAPPPASGARTSSGATVPAALVLAVVGVIIALANGGTEVTDALQLGPSEPAVHVPNRSDWWRGFVLAAVPQLPLTILNSVVSVCELSESLYGASGRAAPPREVATSVGAMNLVGCWFGVMPCCHGAGGLAGQHRFGARSGMAILFLGGMKILLGLLFGSSLGPLLGAFPSTVLGVLLLVAGVELASTCHKETTQRGAFVMLVTATVTLTWKTAAGCGAGIACELVLWARDSISRWRNARRDRAAPVLTKADDESVVRPGVDIEVGPKHELMPLSRS